MKPAALRIFSSPRSRASHAWWRLRLRAGSPAAAIVPVTTPSDEPAWPVAVSPARSPAFDGERAFALLRAQCAVGPRAPGMPEHDTALGLLTRELARWTDEAAVQRWRQPVKRGLGRGDTFALTNVLGVVRGTDAAAGDAPTVLIAGHWDTRAVADQETDPARRGPVPGANDGASGTAVVLELARALSATRPRVTVAFALLDGEDLGEHYYGSRVLAAELTRPRAARWRPHGAVVLDMVGRRDLRCTTEIQSVSQAPALWNRVHASADALGLAHHFHGPAQRVNDDHVALNRAGIQAVVLIDYTDPGWHTLNDVPEHCSPASLQAVGDVVLHFVRGLGAP